MASAALPQKKDDHPAPAGRSRRTLVAGAVLALVVALGAGGYAWSSMGGDAVAASDEGHGHSPTAEAAAASEETPAHGAKRILGPGARAVVTLGSFTVNLRGNGGGRVLRAEVQLEVDASDEEALLEKKAMLRDSVLTLTSDYTFADLEGVEGKTRLRDELQARLNSLLEGKIGVKRVYFTEFVVQ